MEFQMRRMKRRSIVVMVVKNVKVLKATELYT